MLAERALSGDRAAVDGYVQDGRVVIYGGLDSLVYPDAPSFLRHQYPSQLPTTMQFDELVQPRQGVHRVVPPNRTQCVPRRGQDTTASTTFFSALGWDGLR
ncbi:MAG TPA: hypothetical protein VNP92_08350, partial [Actinophytocola sp.]|nr:hypothetical protein [Actinophytocola sp.]